MPTHTRHLYWIKGPTAAIRQQPPDAFGFEGRLYAAGWSPVPHDTFQATLAAAAAGSQSYWGLWAFIDQEIHETLEP